MTALLRREICCENPTRPSPQLYRNICFNPRGNLFRSLESGPRKVPGRYHDPCTARSKIYWLDSVNTENLLSWLCKYSCTLTDLAMDDDDDDARCDG